MLSGKKKQHTHKIQLAVDETTGCVVDVRATVRGPTADLTLLKQSRLLERLPMGGGRLGDLAYVGMDRLHPHELGATPRRKPRGNPQPTENIAYHQAFARRITVEHTIGRMRCFQALAQRHRHHQRHTSRVDVVAGLANRCLGRKRP